VEILVIWAVTVQSVSKVVGTIGAAVMGHLVVLPQSAIPRTTTIASCLVLHNASKLDPVDMHLHLPLTMA
jgi:hypothetical protein